MRLGEELVAHDAGGKSLLVPAGAVGWAGVVCDDRAPGILMRRMGTAIAYDTPVRGSG